MASEESVTDWNRVISDKGLELSRAIARLKELSDHLQDLAPFPEVDGVKLDSLDRQERKRDALCLECAILALRRKLASARIEYRRRDLQSLIGTLESEAEAIRAGKGDSDPSEPRVLRLPD